MKRTLALVTCLTLILGIICSSVYASSQNSIEYMTADEVEIVVNQKLALSANSNASTFNVDSSLVSINVDEHESFYDEDSLGYIHKYPVMQGNQKIADIFCVDLGNGVYTVSTHWSIEQNIDINALDTDSSYYVSDIVPVMQVDSDGNGRMWCQSACIAMIANHMEDTTYSAEDIAYDIFPKQYVELDDLFDGAADKIVSEGKFTSAGFAGKSEANITALLQLRGYKQAFTSQPLKINTIKNLMSYGGTAICYCTLFARYIDEDGKVVVNNTPDVSIDTTHHSVILYGYDSNNRIIKLINPSPANIDEVQNGTESTYGSYNYIDVSYENGQLFMYLPLQNININTVDADEGVYKVYKWQTNYATFDNVYYTGTGLEEPDTLDTVEYNTYEQQLQYLEDNAPDIIKSTYRNNSDIELSAVNYTVTQSGGYLIANILQDGDIIGKIHSINYGLELYNMYITNIDREYIRTESSGEFVLHSNSLSEKQPTGESFRSYSAPIVLAELLNYYEGTSYGYEDIIRAYMPSKVLEAEKDVTAFTVSTRPRKFNCDSIEALMQVRGYDVEFFDSNNNTKSIKTYTENGPSILILEEDQDERNRTHSLLLLGYSKNSTYGNITYAYDSYTDSLVALPYHSDTSDIGYMINDSYNTFRYELDGILHIRGNYFLDNIEK